MYYDSDFSSFRNLERAKDVRLGDLDNAIHPVFGVQNFEDDLDYEILRPSLRLASLLLEEPSLFSFWHAMFFGPETELLDLDLETRHSQKMFSYCRTDGELSAEDIVKTGEKLLALAKVIRFIRKEDQNMSRLGGCCISEKCEMPETFWGVGSRILYRDNFYNDLRSLELNPKDPDTREHDHDWELLTSRFGFAILMLHELAHAAQSAVLGHDSYEHFFEDDVVAEAGFAWENFVFGGTVGDGHTLGGLKVVSLREFPHVHDG